MEVDEIKSTGDLGEMVERRRRYAALTAEKRRLAAEMRQTEGELSALEEQLLDDYAELGTDSMRVEVDGHRFTVHLATEVFARPKRSGVDDRGKDVATEADWARACSALREAGLDHMVNPRFSVQSFAAWVRERRTQDGPGWRDALQPELVDALDIGTRQRVRVRKS